MRSPVLIVVCFSLVTFVSARSRAQEMEPRSYSNVPVGTNFLAASYVFSRGNIVVDAALPIEDFRVTAHTAVVGYVRALDLFGKLAKIQAVVPYSWLAGDAKIAGRDTSGTRSGLNDARAKFTVNLFGGPALSRDQFTRYRQETIIGASVIVSLPIGEYDSSRRINLGSNRWGVKPEVGLSHRFGQWYTEVYSGIWFTTRNDEFLVTSTLSQEPVWTTQGHLSYVFRPGLWLAADGVYVNGGETSVDGVAQSNMQKNWRFGATCAVPITPQHGLKFVFNTGVATRVGADFDSFTVVYQYSWF